MAWFTEGVKVNPLAGALLADTGALADSTHSFQIIIASSVAGVFVLEQRNAVNDGTALDPASGAPRSQVVPIAAFKFDQLELAGAGLTFAEGERLRVIVSAAVVGQCQAMIREL